MEQKNIFKIINPDDYLQSLFKTEPFTKVELGKKVEIRKKIGGNVEEKIIAEHFSEHFLDIGGWKAKEFLEVTDVEKKSENRFVEPLELQKFEFRDFRKEAEEKRIAEENIRIDAILRINDKEVVKKSEDVSVKVVKPPEVYLENEDLRLARLQAKNHRVCSMVNSLLQRSLQKRPVRTLISYPKK